MADKCGIVQKIYELASRPEEVMDCEHHDVKPHEVKQWLECFANGIHYIYETYNHLPGRFGIFNSVSNHLQQETDHILLMDAEADTIVVTRNFIAKDIKNTRGLKAIFGNYNTGHRSDFTGPEMFTLLGVEEAYHSYQYQHMAHKYSIEDWQAGANQNNTGSDDYYKNNPIEKDASIVVLKAADDLKFGLKNKAHNDNNIDIHAEQPTFGIK